MVLRNKSISPTAKNVQLSLSYGEPDVSDMFKWLCRCYLLHGFAYDVSGQLARPFTEQDILYMLSHDLHCFGNYQEKWAQKLAEWCFLFALRIGLIIKSAVEENTYYFTESCLEKKRGRPLKTQESQSDS